MAREDTRTVQIGMAYVPILKAVAEKHTTSMRKVIENFILEEALKLGIVVKNES